MKKTTNTIAKIISAITITASTAGVIGGVMTHNASLSLASALLILINVALLISNKITAAKEA